MKKTSICVLVILFLILLGGFSSYNENGNDKPSFNLQDLYDYHKQYDTEQLEVCADSTAKTYMDYRMTTVVASKQYQFMRKELTVDKNTGFLYDKDGFIAVALGSYYGGIGDRFYFTLESGIVLPLVKAEEKADRDTDATGCYHLTDSSIIEFVIDDDYAARYFGNHGNGLVLNGNYNNYSLFKGKIAKVEKVLEEKNKKLVTFVIETKLPEPLNIFSYGSGY